MLLKFTTPTAEALSLGSTDISSENCKHIVVSGSKIVLPVESRLDSQSTPVYLGNYRA